VIDYLGFGFGRRSPGMWRNPGCRDALDLDRLALSSSLEFAHKTTTVSMRGFEGYSGRARKGRTDGQEPMYFIYDNVGEKH